MARSTEAAAVKASDFHPVTAYAVDVVDGRIVTGKPVLWQCRKHLEDLEHGEKRAGIWFDEAAADRIATFFEQMVLVEGEAAGEPISLEPWQHFALGSPFGWMREDGARRYREVWIRVARGNWKSGMAAGVGLYCTGWDGSYRSGTWKTEERAQVYSAATKLAQAAIVHKLAIRMAEKSPYLKSHLRLPLSGADRVARVRIVHPASGSFFEPLGRDSHTEDGGTPSCVLFDEVHAYGDGGMWDVQSSAMVKRRQPLLFAITTAGHGGPESFGMLQDDYYRSLLDPRSGKRNDSAFVYIAEIDPRTRCAVCRGSGKRDDGERCKKCKGRGYLGDDYADERVWVKANPNLGVSVFIEGMRARVQKAQENKREEPDVLVKNFNLWQGSHQKGIDIEAWDASGLACPMPPEAELKKRPCFAGLDLASNRDLVALDLFWPACGPWKTAAVKACFWVAEETIAVRLKEDRADYRPWIDAGEIFVTPGEFNDQEVIRRFANDLAKTYSIRAIGADRKFGEKLLPELEQDGFNVERIAQSFGNLCPPWQMLEQLVGNQLLAHGGNSVLRWNAENVVLARDPDGLEIPSKRLSKKKIDGIAALLDAIYLAMSKPYEGPKRRPEGHVLSKQRGGGRRAILGAFK